MPIQVSLFTFTIGGKQYAFDTGDIAFSDASTKQIPKNVGTDILEIPLRKRRVTFTIRGASGTDLTNLVAERENVLLQIVNATEPVTGDDIQIGADIIYSAILTDVQPGVPIEVGGNSILEQVQVVYDSTVFV